MSRPISLTIAVTLQWVAGLIALISGLDLMAAGFEISSEGIPERLEAGMNAQGVTDVSGSLLVVGVFVAGVLLVALAVLRVIVAMYLGQGRGWARIVVTVLVVLSMAGGFAYLIQGYALRALLTIPLEAVVLWLMYNAKATAFIRERSAA